jgi:hypothetical protein
MNRFLVLSLLSFALFSSPLPSLAQECVEPPPDMVGWWPGDGDFG